MKKLYLIGGPMGVGKTTICKNLLNVLPNAVFLDGDWCWDASPFTISDETKIMVMDNITYLLNNFTSCSAYENIIFAWVMHKQAIIDEILGRLKREKLEIIKISLISSECKLKEHLLKDIESGYRKMDVIEKSISYRSLYEELDTIKIDTTKKSIFEIVNDIINLSKN